MRSLGILELNVFFLLLSFFLGWDLGLLVLAVLYIYSLTKLMNEEEEKADRRILLEELSGFSNLLQQGYSPLFAYEKMGSFDYPDFIIHPNDELFTWEVFDKQFGLFEKTVLLDEEIEGELMGIRLRMTIMKLMPLTFLLFLRQMLPQADYSGLNKIVAGIFIFNHWLGERLMSKL